MCGAFAVGLCSCSLSSASKKAATTSSASQPGTTARTIAAVASAAAAGNVTVAPTAVAEPASSAVPVAEPVDPGAASSSTAPRARTSSATTVAARVVTNPDDNVHNGDSGAGVEAIQTALTTHGFKVTVDGQFGDKTEQAVKSFQAKNDLKQDGVVGPLTWKKLKAAPSTSTTKAPAKSTTTIKATTTTRL